MNITEITKAAGARPNRKRVGRGEGSGWGKTSGRGHKGHKARSGGKKGMGLLGEGGAFPLFRRLPKVGFNNKNFTTRYQVVNLTALDERFDNSAHVTAAALEEAGLIRDRKEPVKILGDGELTKGLTIEAQRFSASAITKIEAKGGTVKRLGPQPKKKFIKRPPAPKAEAQPEEKPQAAVKAKKEKGPDEAQQPKKEKKEKKAPEDQA
jgi:large subunit ribosomal protein L15